MYLNIRSLLVPGRPYYSNGCICIPSSAEVLCWKQTKCNIHVCLKVVAMHTPDIQYRQLSMAAHIYIVHDNILHMHTNCYGNYGVNEAKFGRC